MRSAASLAILTALASPAFAAPLAVTERDIGEDGLYARLIPADEIEFRALVNPDTMLADMQRRASSPPSKPPPAPAPTPILTPAPPARPAGAQPANAGNGAPSASTDTSNNFLNVLKNVFSRDELRALMDPEVTLENLGGVQRRSSSPPSKPPPVPVPEPVSGPSGSPVSARPSNSGAGSSSAPDAPPANLGDIIKNIFGRDDIELEALVSRDAVLEKLVGMQRRASSPPSKPPPAPAPAPVLTPAPPARPPAGTQPASLGNGAPSASTDTSNNFLNILHNIFRRDEINLSDLMNRDALEKLAEIDRLLRRSEIEDVIARSELFSANELD